MPQSCGRRKTERNRCATLCAAVTEARQGHRPRLLHRKSVTEIAEIVGIAEAGSLPRRPLLTALPRRAVYGGADGEGLIFFSFFSLGFLLLFHSLISLLPHFFEVMGFCLTRFPR